MHGRTLYDGGQGEPAYAATSSAMAGTGTNEVSQIAVPGFTADHVQRILSLINTPNDGNKKLIGKGEWLLDKGALCHMTRHFKHLENV